MQNIHHEPETRANLFCMCCCCKSVEFDDDVALLLSVASLVMGPHVSPKSEAQTLLHWGHRGPVFSFVEAVWRATHRSSEVVIQPFKKLLRPVSQTVLHISLSLARASRSLGLMLHLRRFALTWSMKRLALLWATNWTLSHSELAVEQLTRQLVVRHFDNMPQPSALFLEEQVFSWSYSSFLEKLSVWYFLPPSDAKDALQTAEASMALMCRR